MTVCSVVILFLRVSKRGWGKAEFRTSDVRTRAATGCKSMKMGTHLAKMGPIFHKKKLTHESRKFNTAMEEPYPQRLCPPTELL